MTDAELAHTKELAFWMTERVFMNPISAKLLNEGWRKAFPDEVAVAERMKALVEALETAQRANTAQGDHIEQLQGTIHQLESRTVKIPYLPDDCDRTEAHFKYRAALTAVGINVIEGEENNG